MNGIYLNDIPMDVFIKYFTKENLGVSNFPPVMVDKKDVYTYTLTLDGVPGFIYKSFIGDLAKAKNEIIYNFSDIVVLEAGDITGTVAVANPASDFVYELDQKMTPYQYRFEYNFSTTEETFKFITLPSDTFPQSGIIIDSRNNEPLSINETDIGSVSISDQLVNGTYSVTLGSDIIGHIHENNKIQVHKKNAAGEYLYYNGIQETTESQSQGSFLKYKALRDSGLSILEKRNALIYSKISPGQVALINDGQTERLEFFQTFKKLTSYEIVSNPDPVPTSYRKGIVDVSMSTTPDETLNINKTLLNISSLIHYNFKKVGDNLTRLYTSDVLPQEGETIIANIYQDHVILKGRDIIINSNNTIAYYTAAGSTPVQLIRSVQNNKFMRIPVKVNNSVSVYNEQKGAFEDIQVIKSPTSPRFILNRDIDGQNYEVQKPITDYPYGYIDIIVSVKPLFFKTYIGNFSYNSTTDIVTISNYVVDNTNISIQDNFGNLGYTENTRVSYIQDVYDENLFLKTTETFLLTAGTPVVSPTINTVILNDFKKLFVSTNISTLINRSVTELDLSDRGPLVPGGTIRKSKLSVIRKMVPEFLNNRYNDFYTVDNIAYDIDGTMKMRIYSDGLFEMLTSERLDPSNYKKRLEKISYKDIDDSLILADKEMYTSEEVYKTNKVYNSSLVYSNVVNEMEELNSFQKLLDFENFPSDISREDYLIKKNLRDLIYEDNESTITARDETLIPFVDNKRKRISKLYFKNILIDSLVNYFSDFGVNQTNEKYRDQYEKYYKDKMDNIATDISVDQTQKKISKKNVFIVDDYDNTREDLLIKLVVSDNNWEVL
jgi:hypothetical protein